MAKIKIKLPSPKKGPRLWAISQKTFKDGTTVCPYCGRKMKSYKWRELKELSRHQESKTGFLDGPLPRYGTTVTTTTQNAVVSSGQATMCTHCYWMMVLRTFLGFLAIPACTALSAFIALGIVELIPKDMNQVIGVCINNCVNVNNPLRK